MTNNAIDVLRELKLYTEDLQHYSSDEVATSIELAIKALEHVCLTCKWIKNRPLGNCINCMRSYYDCWEGVKQNDE